MIVFLVFDGGSYLFNEGRKDRNRLYEISDIESRTGKTVGQLGDELRSYCEDMAQSTAKDRVLAMTAQAEKLEKLLGYKSSTPKNYDREREEISNKTFSRCFRLSDVHAVGNLSYEGSETEFKDKIIRKWIKLGFASLFSIVLALALAWASGVFVVRTIPYVCGSIFRLMKNFISWITAPEK